MVVHVVLGNIHIMNLEAYDVDRRFIDKLEESLKKVAVRRCQALVAENPSLLPAMQALLKGVIDVSLPWISLSKERLEELILESDDIREFVVKLGCAKTLAGFLTSPKTSAEVELLFFTQAPVVLRFMAAFRPICQKVVCQKLDVKGLAEKARALVALQSSLDACAADAKRYLSIEVYEKVYGSLLKQVKNQKDSFPQSIRLAAEDHVHELTKQMKTSLEQHKVHERAMEVLRSGDDTNAKAQKLLPIFTSQGALDIGQAIAGLDAAIGNADLVIEEFKEPIDLIEANKHFISARAAALMCAGLQCVMAPPPGLTAGIKNEETLKNDLDKFHVGCANWLYEPPKELKAFMDAVVAKEPEASQTETPSKSAVPNKPSAPSKPLPGKKASSEKLQTEQSSPSKQQLKSLSSSQAMKKADAERLIAEAEADIIDAQVQNAKRIKNAD